MPTSATPPVPPTTPAAATPAAGAATTSEQVPPNSGDTSPSPPRAPRRPHRLAAHGDERIDDLYWLRDRDNPEVIAYLEAENAYGEAVLGPTGPLQAQL